MLAGMYVEHELTERSFETRQTLLKHDETSAGQFCGQLEIHHPKRFAQLEMLPGIERIIALFAEDVMHDIATCVGAIRNIIERRVRNLRQLFVEFSTKSPLLVFERRQQSLEFGNFGHQRVGL